MMQKWLIALGFVVGIYGCSSSSSSDPTAGQVQIVGLEDGTVEVSVQGRTIFAMAGTGPVARTFTEDFFGAGVDKVTVEIPTSLAVDGRLFASLLVTITQ